MTFASYLSGRDNLRSFFWKADLSERVRVTSSSFVRFTEAHDQSNDTDFLLLLYNAQEE